MRITQGLPFLELKGKKKPDENIYFGKTLYQGLWAKIHQTEANEGIRITPSTELKIKNKASRNRKYDII